VAKSQQVCPTWSTIPQVTAAGPEPPGGDVDARVALLCRMRQLPALRYAKCQKRPNVETEETYAASAEMCQMSKAT
jgi:hypothetical protein